MQHLAVSLASIAPPRSRHRARNLNKLAVPGLYDLVRLKNLECTIGKLYHVLPSITRPR